ncbi:MAG: molybdate ABC transporter substrate-binding protein [Acidobacteria bacterium]|nr:molybdate ABC transporter substrate-binding protein [Acidobacteriota bacterium]
MRAIAPIVTLAVTALTAATAAESPGPATHSRPELLVFAAASLTDALGEIGAGFEARTGVRVLFSFAGSNALARQIRAGAPADVFVSANIARMDELEQVGLVRSADRLSLLSNRLVVVVGAASDLVVTQPRDLERARRLALGDPEAVPAGIYARQWLEGRGLWERLRDRVVPTLDVRAALAAVESGAAEAGIVYRSDVAIAQRARVAFEVPAEQAPRIVYPAAVIASSRSSSALPFLEYLQSPDARAVFTRLGFEPLDGR